MFPLVFCTSCIGVDVRDAAIREEAINILATGKLLIKDSNGVIVNKGSLAFLSLKIGEKQLVTVEYFNQYGVKEDPTLTWTVVTPSVASVSANEVTALAPGTTFISAARSSGAKDFDLPSVTLNQYKYVVVLCKPAGVTFGFAELKP